MTDAETETAGEDEKFAEARHGTQDELHLDQSLFAPFTLGDLKRIDSTPDHQVILFFEE